MTKVSSATTNYIQSLKKYLRADMMMKAEEIGSCKHSTRLLLFFDGTYVCTQIISRARHVSRVPNGWTHYVPHKTPCVYNVTVVRFHPLFKCVCVCV